MPVWSVESGFTLIELLMIIVVLGILASLVIYATQDLAHKTATSACQSDFKTVETAQETFTGQVGHAATSIAELENPMTINGQPVGPWLKDTPGNTSHYVIGIDDGSTPGGSVGRITVASFAPAHAATDGAGNCAYA